MHTVLGVGLDWRHGNGDWASQPSHQPGHVSIASGLGGMLGRRRLGAAADADRRCNKHLVLWHVHIDTERPTAPCLHCRIPWCISHARIRSRNTSPGARRVRPPTTTGRIPAVTRPPDHDRVSYILRIILLFTKHLISQTTERLDPKL